MSPVVPEKGSSEYLTIMLHNAQERVDRWG